MKLTGYPLTPQARKQVWLRLTLRLGILLAILALLCCGVFPLLLLSLPLLAGAGLSLLLEPAVAWTERRLKLSRPIAALLALVTLLILLGSGCALLVQAAVRELLTLLDNWQSVWNSASDALNARLPGTEGIAQTIYEFLQARIPSLARWATNAFSAAPKLVTGLLFFLLSAYFFSAELPHLRALLLRAWPKLHHSARPVCAPAGQALCRYLQIQLLLSLAVFFLLLIALSLLHQPYALVCSILAALVDLIPMVGAGLVLFPWAAVEYLLGHAGVAGVLVILTILVWLLHRMLEPKLLGKALGINPLALLCALYLGSKLGGAAGGFLALLCCLLLPHLWRSGALNGICQDLTAVFFDSCALLRKLFTGG